MTMRDRTLIPKSRECCVCGASLPLRARLAQGQERIASIIVYIYRRGLGKKQLGKAEAVRVCETCLIKAVTAGRLNWSMKGNVLWDQIRKAISLRYDRMVSTDEWDHKIDCERSKRKVEAERLK
jgi:hypothetical protein